MKVFVILGARWKCTEVWMWGIVAVAVVDRWGEVAYLRFFFNVSRPLSLGSHSCLSCECSGALPPPPPAAPLTLGFSSRSCRRPSFLEVLRSSKVPDGPVADSDVPSSNSPPSLLSSYASSLSSVFHVRSDDALTLQLLLFAALDKSEAIMVDEARKCGAFEDVMMGDEEVLSRRMREERLGPGWWGWRRKIWGWKEEDKGLKGGPKAALFPHSPCTKESCVHTSRRKTVPFVEWEEDDNRFSGPTLMAHRVDLNRHTRKKGKATQGRDCYSSCSCSQESLREIHGSPSSCGVLTPRVGQGSSEFSPLNIEDHATDSRTLPGGCDSLEYLESTGSSMECCDGGKHADPSYCRKDERCCMDDASRSTGTTFSSSSWSTCTSTTTGTFYSINSLPCSDDNRSYSTSSSSSELFLHPFSRDSSLPSLLPSTYQQRLGDDEKVSCDHYPCRLSTFYTEKGWDHYPVNLKKSLSHRLSGKHQHPPYVKPSGNTVQALLESSTLIWNSAPFSSFATSGSLSPTFRVPTGSGSLGGALPSPSGPQYLGKVAASPDDRFQCYACCAGTGIRVLVVTVTRSCRDNCSVDPSSCLHSSSSSSTSDDREERTEHSEKDYWEGSSEDIHPLEYEGDPSDDAMIPITRSILESVSVAVFNPLSSGLLLPTSKPPPSPHDKNAEAFFHVKTFSSPPQRHSLLPSLPHLKTVLMHSRSFHSQLERIIGSLEFS